MTTFHLVAEMSFTSDPVASDEQFDAFIDAVMEELSDLDVVDPDMVGSFADRTVAFTMGIEAEDFEDAVPVFLSALRSALHAAGAHTPEWPVFERHIQAIRPLELVDA